MSTNSGIPQSVYSPSETENPQGSTTSKIQNFDQSLNHVDLRHSIEQSVKSDQKEKHQKRIESLRKELDYLKNTEWKYEYDREDDEKDDAFLAEQILELEIENEKNNIHKEIVEIDIPKETVCFQRTGVVTYKDEDNGYILIDGSLFFDITPCYIKVEVRDKVLYLGYKDNNDSIKVVRILENQGLLWGDEEVEENSYKVIEHVIVGEVEDRVERFVLMKNSDLKFNLDDVASTFVPVKGDFLELLCSLQWDEDKPSEISSSQVLKVKSLKPVRSKIREAVVTSWNGEEGTCDNFMHFDRQCLTNQYEPKVGYKVIAETIESNQGRCTWRIVKLSFLDNGNTNIPSEPPAEIAPSVEKEKQIDVTNPLKFEKVDFAQTQKISLDITNNSDQTYTINKWIMLSNKRDSQVQIKPFLNKPVFLHPKETFNFTITCQPKFLGNSKECLIVMFKGFKIKRFIEINVVDKSMSVPNIIGRDYCNSNALIQTMKNVRRNQKNDFVPGVRPIKPPNFIAAKLGQYPIPDKIWSVILQNSEPTTYISNQEETMHRLENCLPYLTQSLNINNYIDKWHTLLFLEEIQMSIFMRIYDMEKAFMTRYQQYLALEIKGLSERRPSLIAGDRVIVKDMWDTNVPQYEGYVHEIRGDLALMKFNAQFHETYSGSDVSIEFHFTRTTYRRAHQAVNLALSNLGPDILFPSRIMKQPPQLKSEKLEQIEWYNNDLNSGQKAAVTNILSGECRPMPYIIYGPPGTGKTVTVIETILQIVTLLPESRILVATPSNSACNLITERLIKYKKHFSGSMIRLIANYLVDSEKIPDIIKPYCATLDFAREDTAKPRYNVNKNGTQMHCQSSLVGRHRILIGTCFCIGALSQLGLPRGHFTHVIIDEAGQATEPEIMIPLSLVEKANSQIILAGDPMQLGPVILSNYCKNFGMEESFLERILETFPYQTDLVAFKDGYNPKLVTKLNYNYRSLLEAILLPSKLFYNNSLVPKFDRSSTGVEEMIRVVADTLDTNDDTGGIFVYGIRGCNTRAEDSPSWFNPQEASMVALTTCKLYKKNVAVDDIGIITPYVAQIKYLRYVFNAMGLPMPKIGTVEEFQGQERAIILITTVRSTESLLSFDHRYKLGFINSPKRVNVAITRAQIATLIFCDPHLLCTDKLWFKVVSEAVTTNKYVGCDLPLILNKPLINGDS